MSLLHIAGGATEDKLYVEDVFSAYLYTGNGSTQTINNGIDSSKGVMTWIKGRSSTSGHYLFDTIRGSGKYLGTNSTGIGGDVGSIQTFTSTGFSIGGTGELNANGSTLVSWSFRRSPKFFDVVTWTGDGTDNRQLSHNLGCEVGFFIVKRLNSTSNWFTYHRSIATAESCALNLTASVDFSYLATPTSGNRIPTDSVFYVDKNRTNISGATYVAYLFAHDPSADGIIQCGSYTTNSSAVGSVSNLPWEPQYILVKAASGTSDWNVFDTMRGWLGVPFTGSNYSQLLKPNSSAAETGAAFQVTPNGFVDPGAIIANGTCIYLAIRRPMKVPTSGTEVFAVSSRTANSPAFTAPFPVDLAWLKRTPGSDSYAYSRLTQGKELALNAVTAEATATGFDFDYMAGYRDQVPASATEFSWMFHRAKGFMDIVCYTGTGVARTVNHNLGVVPELMIVKSRSSTVDNWPVYNKTIWSSSNTLYLNLTNGALGGGLVWDSAPTESVFYVGTASATNASAATCVAYLFASCPNVSKIGSYTGNGSSQTINCGFSAGARFVLIKRTDATGDWYIWDTARGIVAANDPHLSLNTTAAEITTDDSIDPASSGFIVNQNTATNINVNGASYIFLAIA